MASLVHLEVQDSLAKLGSVVLQELLAYQEREEWLERLDHLDLQGKLEQLVLEVSKDPGDLLDHLDCLALRELLVNVVQLDLLDLKAQLDLLGKEEVMELQVKMGQEVRLEREEPQAMVVHQDNAVRQDLPGNQVQVGALVLQEKLDSAERLAYQEEEDNLDNQDNLVISLIYFYVKLFIIL